MQRVMCWLVLEFSDAGGIDRRLRTPREEAWLTENQARLLLDKFMLRRVYATEYLSSYQMDPVVWDYAQQELGVKSHYIYGS